jgi:hypothetical protein
MPLKYLGFFDLPITQGSSFSEPSVFVVKVRVIRSLLFFPLFPVSVTSRRSGISFQKRPVSSILNISLSLYLEQMVRGSAICWIVSGSLMSTDLPSPCYTNSLILYLFLKPSSYPFDHFGSIECLNWGGRFHNSAVFALRISPVITAFFCQRYVIYWICRGYIKQRTDPTCMCLASCCRIPGWFWDIDLDQLS